MFLLVVKSLKVNLFTWVLATACILLSYGNMSHASSMPAEDRVNDFVTRKIIFQEGIILEDQDKLKNSFRELAQNFVGKHLIKRVDELLEDRKTHKALLIKNGEQHCFCAPKKEEAETGQPSLEINFAKLKTDPLSTVTGPLPPAIRVDGVDLYPIAPMQYPFKYVLGHELIHLLHFLKYPRAIEEGNDELATISKHLNYYDCNIKIDFRFWPQKKLLSTKEREELLWGGKIEEQRTLIGIPQNSSLRSIDIQEAAKYDADFSELTLLLVEGYLPRYAYQGMTYPYFYELPNIIDLFLKEALQSVLMRDFLGPQEGKRFLLQSQTPSRSLQPIESEVNFKPHEARLSPLNPLSYQQQLDREYIQAEQAQKAAIAELSNQEMVKDIQNIKPKSKVQLAFEARLAARKEKK